MKSRKSTCSAWQTSRGLRYAAGIGLVTASMFVAGLGGSSAATTHSQPLTTVTITGFPYSVYDGAMPIYAANSLGYAKKNGINFDYQFAESGTAEIQAVADGAVNYDPGAPVGGVAAAIKAGAAITAFAPALVSGAGWYLMTTPSSGITKLSQLNGKSICISSVGSSTYDYAAWLISSQHISATLVPVGGAGQEPTLLSGKTAACMEVNPTGYELVKSGQAKILYDFGKADLETGLWIAQTSFLKSHIALTKRVLLAWYQTVAKLQKDQKIAANILEKIANEPPVAAKYDASIFKLYPLNGNLPRSDIASSYRILLATESHAALPPESALASSMFANVSGK